MSRSKANPTYEQSAKKCLEITFSYHFFYFCSLFSSWVGWPWGNMWCSSISILCLHVLQPNRSFKTANILVKVLGIWVEIKYQVRQGRRRLCVRFRWLLASIGRGDNYWLRLIEMTVTGHARSTWRLLLTSVVTEMVTEMAERLVYPFLFFVLLSFSCPFLASQSYLLFSTRLSSVYHFLINLVDYQ